MKPAIMIIGENKCIGCYGCYNICLNRAIEMKLNKEGFITPYIIKNKCINCGICQEYCPILNNKKTLQPQDPTPYAAWSRDTQIIKNSSSGGIFTELAHRIIKNGGIVFGVAFNEEFMTKHIPIRNTTNINLIQGSKYIQSHVNDSYIKAVDYAKQGKKVLFSGTPCQIAALNIFIQKNPNLNIYTCDVICHGVPSESIYSSYLKYLKQKYKANIKNINFREKSNGWKSYNIKIMFDNKKQYIKNYQEDPFFQGYMKNLYLRPICYNCPFSKIPRVSDITLGDYWGVPPKLLNPLGVSIVLINNNKGKKLFNEMKKIYKKKIHLKDITPHNPTIYNGIYNTIYDRNKIMNHFIVNKDFNFIYKKYIKPLMYKNTYIAIKKWLTKIFKYLKII